MPLDYCNWGWLKNNFIVIGVNTYKRPLQEAASFEGGKRVCQWDVETLLARQAFNNSFFCLESQVMIYAPQAMSNFSFSGRKLTQIFTIKWSANVPEP